MRDASFHDDLFRQTVHVHEHVHEHIYVIVDVDVNVLVDVGGF
jgi:hypothetical protein